MDACGKRPDNSRDRINFLEEKVENLKNQNAELIEKVEQLEVYIWPIRAWNDILTKGTRT